MDIYKKLEELNIEILQAPKKGGIYNSVRSFGGNMAYVSGTAPNNSRDEDIVGKLGSDLSIADGQEAARRCAVNIISVLHHELGDLNKIKSLVKILGFVSSSSEFGEQPQVINGASQVFKDVFGDEVGLPARSAIGVNALPWNIPVEIELLLELKD